MVLSLCIVFKPYLGPIHDLNLKLFVGDDTKMLMLNDTSSSLKIAKDLVTQVLVEETRSSLHVIEDERVVPKNTVNATGISQQIAKVEDNATKIFINDTSSSPTKVEVEKLETRKVEQPLCVSEVRTEYCQTEGDIRLHGKSSNVYIASRKTTILAENMSWSIRPYARKSDAYAMSNVTKWSVKTSQQVPQCTKNHSIPAVIFSTAGYTGNHFHEFSDIMIPLFLTCRQFNGQVQLIITDKKPWWIVKHQAFLKKLSNYKIMDIDIDDEVHCFPRVIVGLKRYYQELSIDPQKYSYSIKDFRDFLRSSYSLKRDSAIKIRDGNKSKKPRLLILSRKTSRSFTNTNQIAKTAKGLGFKVIVMEAGRNMLSIADAVNSCDVLMGVHGAGLTNILFLPQNAIFIQIVPYGGMQVEWLATNDFAKPSEEMNIKYLEYKIRLEESTLIKQYPLDHMIIKDPSSIEKQGWEVFRSVYFDKQNVKLDVDRFRPTLQKALELLH
ncbi:alpha-1,3-arabinosyltransferase XAT3-like isoform X2 [Cicer arietinum]|uniref:Protein O-linked-mannose beta-1,4-N-acetylglucosaminyltransferase 2-like isoform X2 n=1 Tax=Cicer arietinum TaxID=3827 RepID=A0A1S2YDW9_CICAR|nr:protein O-linked-mannose beta-1,4-N-acetylglucosaminyltransferase 2-like isoform X2 [Cicer arietinum]